MKLSVPLFAQRNPDWGDKLLGFNSASSIDAFGHPYNIHWYGCLITCLGMLVNKKPDEVNRILQENGGFEKNTGNFIWTKSTVLKLTQLYVSPEWTGPVSDQGIVKVKEYIDQGYPCLAEVDFNPATTGEEMHYVLISGYENDTFYINDPWTGNIENFDRYGGVRRGMIQYRVYDKKFTQGTVKPIVEVFTDVFEELVTKATTIDEAIKLLEISGTFTKDIFLGKLKTQKEYIVSLEDENRKKQQMIDAVLEEKESLGIAINQQKQKIEELERDIQNLQKNLNEDIKNMQIRINELSEENKVLTIQKNQLEEQLKKKYEDYLPAKVFLWVIGVLKQIGEGILHLIVRR